MNLYRKIIIYTPIGTVAFVFLLTVILLFIYMLLREDSFYSSLLKFQIFNSKVPILGDFAQFGAFKTLPISHRFYKLERFCVNINQDETTAIFLK